MMVMMIAITPSLHASCRLPCIFHLLPSADLFRELATAFHRY